jgi:hypothetical protein
MAINQNHRIEGLIYRFGRSCDEKERSLHKNNFVLMIWFDDKTVRKENR